MATLSDIRLRAAELLNDTGFNTNSQAFYTQCVNDAQREIAENLKLLWKKDTTTSSVDGTQSYALPTDYMSLYNDQDSVVYTDTNSTDHYLRYYPYKVLREMYDDLTDTTVTGTPSLFWIQEDSIYLYKTPDYDGSSNISIEYYYYPATLSSDSSTSDLPDKYKMAIVYLVAAKVSDRNELWDQGIMFRTRYYLSELNRINNASGDAVEVVNGSSRLNYLG